MMAPVVPLLRGEVALTTNGTESTQMNPPQLVFIRPNVFASFNEPRGKSARGTTFCCICDKRLFRRSGTNSSVAFRAPSTGLPLRYVLA
jgi:hypothetical protein